MAPLMVPSGESAVPDPHDFSVVLGGPLYQLLRGAHLADDALMLVRQRLVVIALFAWLPLLLLSTLEGRVVGRDAGVPFLWDVDVHVRFLVALPLLIVAELVVHQRMGPLVRQFVSRRLVPEDAMTRFDAIVASALRLRNSISAEVLLIIAVYGVGVLVIWRHHIALDTATWYATPDAEGTKLSLAGMWYGYVSLPIFQFLLTRWYFRLFIWTRFLWQVSRIALNLVPTHPDRVAGLGFLSGVASALVPLVAAHGALLAGLIANRILHLGEALPDFKLEIAAVVILMQCVVFGPLLVVAPQVARVKRKGSLAYGALAQRYVREFDTKWLRGGAAPDESLVGSGDIQSLADLGNSLEVVQTMRVAPVSRDAVLRVAVTTLAPVTPLALTLMPLEELVKALLQILL
jgi:hypothetical protein